MRILLVEDETLVRESIKEAIAIHSHHEVLEASNAYEAKKLIEQDICFDLVITDLNMKRIDGFGTGADLIDYIFKKDYAMPIVVISGHSDLIVKYSAISCIYKLQKPLDFRELNNIILQVEEALCKCEDKSCGFCNITKQLRGINSKVNDLINRYEGK